MERMTERSLLSEAAAFEARAAGIRAREIPRARVMAMIAAQSGGGPSKKTIDEVRDRARKASMLASKGGDAVGDLLKFLDKEDQTHSAVSPKSLNKLHHMQVDLLTIADLADAVGKRWPEKVPGF